MQLPVLVQISMIEVFYLTFTFSLCLSPGKYHYAHWWIHLKLTLNSYSDLHSVGASHMEQEIRYPTSLQDVIQVRVVQRNLRRVPQLTRWYQLVQRLYQPGSPTTIVKVQEILQQVQRSADGWTLANALLGNPDQQVQFFGALTFMVKLNSDWYAPSARHSHSPTQAHLV